MRISDWSPDVCSSDLLGLRLDPGDAIEARDRAVEHAKRALDLDREVDVARRVDDVDPVIVPETGRRGRRDRDPALLLLLHPVHRRGPPMGLADLVVLAGIEMDALDRKSTRLNSSHLCAARLPSYAQKKQT